MEEDECNLHYHPYQAYEGEAENGENGEQAVEGVRAFEAVKEVEGSPLEAVREVRQEADRLENGLK